MRNWTPGLGVKGVAVALIVVMVWSCSGCASLSLGASQNLAIGATMLDIGSTGLALTRCPSAREGNPLLASAQRVTVWSVVVNMVLIGAYYAWSNNYPEQSRAFGWQIIGGLHLAAATSNLYQVNRCKK